MSILTLEEITNLFLYGTKTTPSDLISIMSIMCSGFCRLQAKARGGLGGSSSSCSAGAAMA